MSQWNSTRDRQARPAHQIPAPPPALYFLGTAAGILTIVSLAPPLAWLSGAERHSNGVTIWDVAGALAFIGFAAGMLTGPEQIRELFGPETMAR